MKEQKYNLKLVYRENGAGTLDIQSEKKKEDESKTNFPFFSKLMRH